MLELLARIRKEKSGQNKRIRKQGLVPAVLYGRGIKNALLCVDSQDLKKAYKEAGTSALIKLKIKDVKEENERVVLIQDVANNPVNGKIIHVDFNQVKMDEKVTVEVSLVFVNKSTAVKREGGVLIKNIQSIEIRALPQDLPKEIEVDISAIKSFEDNIRVKDLKISENVEILANQEDVIASVVPPRTSAELEELQQAPTEKIEEVEVEQKGKEKGEAVQGKEGSVSEEKTSAKGEEENK